MAKLVLYVGNKNYSSWSMRPWILARQAEIPFEERMAKFSDDGKPKGLERVSPTRKVPLLLVDGEPVWDSLAICEALAEMFPEKQLWPSDPAARRMARCVCAEMHSGFQALRASMNMNIRSSHPDKGRNPDSLRDIERVLELWSACRERFGREGPLLFGRFSIADAYYAPVVMRFRTYAVPLPAQAEAYVKAVENLSAVREWIDAARKETEFVAVDEPYAKR
ncbi:MAG: glutathione S-transferase [Betaproteobacteria bacterium]|jgi:glutathione S-transferase|nr:glutathione S-transferase [Betaproteobacteria bacterium]